MCQLFAHQSFLNAARNEASWKNSWLHLRRHSSLQVCFPEPKSRGSISNLTMESSLIRGPNLACVCIPAITCMTYVPPTYLQPDTLSEILCLSINCLWYLWNPSPFFFPPSWSLAVKQEAFWRSNVQTPLAAGGGPPRMAPELICNLILKGTVYNNPWKL